MGSSGWPAHHAVRVYTRCTWLSLPYIKRIVRSSAISVVIIMITPLFSPSHMFCVTAPSVRFTFSALWFKLIKWLFYVQILLSHGRHQRYSTYLSLFWHSRGLSRCVKHTTWQIAPLRDFWIWSSVMVSKPGRTHRGRLITQCPTRRILFHVSLLCPRGVRRPIT